MSLIISSADQSEQMRVQFVYKSRLSLFKKKMSLIFVLEIRLCQLAAADFLRI